jgi:hypothetical protein
VALGENSTSAVLGSKFNAYFSIWFKLHVQTNIQAYRFKDVFARSQPGKFHHIRPQFGWLLAGIGRVNYLIQGGQANGLAGAPNNLD